MDDVRTHSGSYQAYQILYIGFTALPIIAGLDKFVQLLAAWERYLAPAVAGLLPVAPRTFMLGVGIVEVLAGLMVAVKPVIGAWVVGLWLVGIVINLLIGGAYLDIALRDFGLALGAFALARLAADEERRIA